MEARRKNRRLIALAAVGLAACIGAAGVRVFHRKPMYGTWIGYCYQNIDGSFVPDKDFGRFVIEILPNGEYRENGNSTSGTWKQDGDKLELTPTHFMELTPADLRKKYRKSSGEPSTAMELLLKSRMRPMMVTYHHLTDRMIYKEPTLHFEYERYK